jgi:hypothetical protein
VRRAREAPAAGRLRLALGTPLVPLVLWARVARERGAISLAAFVAATPAVLLIYGAWGLGELVGYLTGRV